MKLPSKTTPYKNSVLSIFPSILRILQQEATGVVELHEALPNVDFGEMISALDCLFALGKIELDAERGVLYYADSDSM